MIAFHKRNHLLCVVFLMMTSGWIHDSHGFHSIRLFGPIHAKKKTAVQQHLLQRPTTTTTTTRITTTPSFLSSTTTSSSYNNNSNKNMFSNDDVPVAKTGGRGAVTASQQALQQNLSLGAPPARPKGGHYMTKGGIQVTANVQPLTFITSHYSTNSNNYKTQQQLQQPPLQQQQPQLSSLLGNDGTLPSSSAEAISQIIQQLDTHRGVLLTSSYEFPGRYARWSLGFVDPPLEVAGKGNQATIRALNRRGQVLMPALEQAMRQLQQDGILERIQIYQDTNGSQNAGEVPSMVRMDVTVVPPPEVGTFSEEERSRQVRSKKLALQEICLLSPNHKLPLNVYIYLSSLVSFGSLRFGIWGYKLYI